MSKSADYGVEIRQEVSSSWVTNGTRKGALLLMLLMTTANLHRNTSFLVHFSLRSTYVPCLICVSISVKLGLLKRQLNESFFLSIIALLSLKCIKYFSFGGCFGKLNRSQSFSCVVPLYKKAF